jgi:class 3 adenylate cyclase
MNTIAMLTASGDLDHLQRMHQLATASRRPAAVLFADLEGSAQLSKRMPTAAYFKLIRRITRAADQCVVEAGGLVGRHAGDGVAAFFVAETLGSDSTAARACIAAAKALQSAMADLAERQDLAPTDVTVRAGLHWGATLHIGSIITIGRTEVTALGDAVNEASRIEACASGGRILASKDLVERLDLADAALLGIDPDRMSYTQLGDLETATEKARRDAPAIPVCDVAAIAH